MIELRQRPIARYGLFVLLPAYSIITIIYGVSQQQRRESTNDERNLYS